MKDESRLALEALGMDLNQTLARFVGNEGLLFKFLGRLPNDQTFAQLTASMEAGNAEEAFHHAHTLKGVVGNLGLGTLFDAVSPMVELLRNDQMAEAEALYPAVKDAYEQAMQTIATLGEGA